MAMYTNTDAAIAPAMIRMVRTDWLVEDVVETSIPPPDLAKLYDALDSILRSTRGCSHSRDGIEGCGILDRRTEVVDKILENLDIEALSRFEHEIESVKADVSSSDRSSVIIRRQV
jgi:hypothetical protein